MMKPHAQQPRRVVVCANQAWNLVNFRAGLIAALLEQGFEVIAVAPPNAEMAAQLEQLGCRFVAAPIDPSGLSPWRDFRTLRAFEKIIETWRPSAWLSWTIKPNIYGAIAAARAGTPAIPNVSGLGTAFIRRNLLTVLVRGLYRWGLRRAHTVFFQNEVDRALFVDDGIVKPGQARIVPGSGIDCDHWKPANWSRPKDRRFLLLGRMVADKGVREFVAAARDLRARYPDAKFILMGFLEVANRTAIPAAEVEGWVREGVVEYQPPAADVRPAILAADFVVLPSYREGMSRVLLEAAALGRPIVTTDVPGCRDIVTEGESGFLCAPRDSASLAAALERAARTNAAEWRVMARNGRKKAIREFSQDRVTELYLQALRAAGVLDR